MTALSLYDNLAKINWFNSLLFEQGFGGQFVASSTDTESKFYLGIDGGGSKCRAVIASRQGVVLGNGLGGSANPLHGFEKTLNSIIDATNKAMNDANMCLSEKKSLIAGIGLAGVNLPILYRQVNQWQHPFGQMYLTTDLDIANIGAHDGHEGAVIIVGTGSCGFSCVDGKKTILGGQGFPIGDKASGAWVGLEAIKHTLLVLDGFEPASLLSQIIVEEFQVNDALALSEKVAGRSSRQFAKLATHVFKAAEQNDPIAASIVNEGVDYIVKMLTMLLSNQPKRLCMLGGLAKFILPRLPDELAKYFVEPIHQPEIGALRYAQHCWRIEQKQSA